MAHRFLLYAVWGGETDVQYLRILHPRGAPEAGADPEQPQHIITETGVGYRLRVQE